MIRHTVLLRIHKDVTDEHVKDIFAGLSALKGQIAGILAVSWGADCSPEGLQKGFTHGFTVDFADATARDAYLPHPAHQKVGAMIVAACDGGVDGILVLDWEMVRG